MRKLTTLLALLGAFLLALPALAADAPAPAKLYFDTGKTDLPADAAKAVAPLADYAKATKDAKLAISGFHDKTGDVAANAELAKKRAMAVKDVLVAAGVTEGALELVKPVETTGAADDREARRVEVSIVGLLVAAPAAASAAGAPAAAAAPTPNKGDNARMIVATLLVIMMSIPGLALFYGGLVRSKNMLSVLMQVFVVFSLIIVLWAVYGYSIAFTEGGAFFGSLDRLFLGGIFSMKDGVGSFATAATFSKGVVIPELIYVAFQATFAAITVCLIVGAFAERIKFSAVLLFAVIWFTFSYLPIAHMVWFWPGPDAFTDAKAAELATSKAGWLFQLGALDFAGGTVVHINAGIAGLVGSYVIGKRIGYGKEAMAPHNLSFTMVGASLLWVGWFGFNAGSALEAGDVAMLAFVNTLIATAGAVLTWTLGEWMAKGKPSMLGAASGAVAGLVAITPACGFVGVNGALIIGLLAGFVCLWGVNGLKRMLGADDALDVFGVHGVGGILGALLTGVFAAPSLGGQGVFDYVAGKVGDYSIASQVLVQAKAVGTTILWSAIVAFVAYKIVDLVIGLRVSEEEEREGLDISSHGESAYRM
ncbi:MAG TPA: ammonium transporter [Casimicrobiaceae bacterium]|nr:ammonium transporter [Casimicrobiaceae bacterium]